jgi:tetratricopeptide (TPR) repeat protein
LIQDAPACLASAPKVVIVGWEGADWPHAQPLLDAGQLPALAALIKNGCSGPIRGFAPWLPPVLWTTLATGVYPDRHGIHGVAVFDPTTGRATVAGPGHRRVPALWNHFTANGRSGVVLGWPGTYPAESLPRGVMASDTFAHAPLGPNDPWTVPDGAVQPVARVTDLAELRLRPQDIDTGLLGLFIPEIKAIDLTLDPRPGWLLQRLSELYTTHNAAVALCDGAQPDLLAVHLPFIATIQKAFGLFQSPRHPAAGADDCQRYGGVVSAAYRVQDALLADLINACEPGTAFVVVSVHGLAHGAARPARHPRSAADYATWCRSHGLLVAQGPGLRTAATISDARIEDFAPTILAWAGLAPGVGINGRILEDIFISPPPFRSARDPDTAGDPTPFIAQVDSPTSPANTRTLLRLADQGLVHPLTVAWREAARLLVAENAFLLGSALLDLQRVDDALAPLHQAFLATPESPQRALSLIHGLIQAGLTDDCFGVAQLFLDHGPHDSRHRLVDAAAKITRQRPTEALELLSAVTELEFAENRRVLERIAFQRLGRPADEVASFQRSLVNQPEAAGLWVGLALAQLRLGEPAQAKTSALQARTLHRNLPGLASVLQHADAALRTGSTKASSRSPMSWSQLMEKAAVRQKQRTELNAQATLYRAELASLRVDQRPAWAVVKTNATTPVDSIAETITSAPDDSSVWTVRPPWPDEIPRIQDHFGPALRGTHHATRYWTWVLMADSRERLTGVIVLSLDQSGDGLQGRIDLDLRDAWIDTSAGDALLSVVLRHAAGVGLVSLDLQTRVSEAMQALLQRKGFAEVIRHEIWTASVPDAMAAHEIEYGRILKRWPVPVEPFHPDQLDLARSICEGTGLLAPEKLWMKSMRHPQGIDPVISFVAGPPRQTVAILLSNINGSRAEVEIVARNPGERMAAPVAVPALLSKFLSTAQQLGCLEVGCSLRPGITPNLIALMTKWNGRCQQRQAIYRHRLG